ncbi:MFS transporter [Candidatus Sodalis endolongispinus]|uniref:MFS transporter n=1 Tax=Candidatus Sodalis endolongispinus TaxID=2812662 RepID=A0ABS5YBI6_9GAMM|nr:MFS transporter [Candidatus Sodalis endolongispinus]MBT9431910.1 MFS transporter [Candidatus Sodalis endolongispinus]
MVKALLILMLGAFVSQTTEYLPIGLLTVIAKDLQVTQGQVGFLVTGYAWIITLTVLPVTLLTRRVDRRVLFLWLLEIIAVCNGLAIITHHYWLLMIVRIAAALGHGVFWSSIAAYAIKIAPAMPSSRVTAIVFAGISLAIVAGVPLSSALGQAFGWQRGFALFGLMIFAAGYLWLPSLQDDIPKAKTRTKAPSAPLLSAIGVTLLMVTGHFTCYTYITALLHSPLNIAGAAIPLHLLLFGVAGALGTLLAGTLSLRPAIMTALAGAGVLVSLLLMLTARPWAGYSWLVMALWGGAIAVSIIALQSWVITLAPDKAEFASALYVMAFNVGIGGGAMAGGLLLERLGSPGLLSTGMIIAIAGLMIWAWAQHQARAACVK